MEEHKEMVQFKTSISIDDIGLTQLVLKNDSSVWNIIFIQDYIFEVSCNYL